MIWLPQAPKFRLKFLDFYSFAFVFGVKGKYHFAGV